MKVTQFVPWPEYFKPKLCLLSPKENSLADYTPENTRVVAPDKYRNLTERFFRNLGLNPQLVFLQGQVDRQVRLGCADIAVDIVCSGKTMLEERLSIYGIVFNDPGLVLITKD